MERVFTDNQEEIVEYDLEKIDPNEKVEVNLKDLFYVYRTLQEYMRFFHQPMHYPEMQDIEDFLGSVNDPAAFTLLKKCVYEKMPSMLPSHIEEKLDDGMFNCSKLPSYYNENRRNK